MKVLFYLVVETDCPFSAVMLVTMVANCSGVTFPSIGVPLMAAKKAV
ncbi:MAG: hypothetical protein NTX91_01960 [candidate division SR1 bacterium]|nr:hypothetical protein [candidate division SR1 bacterium]